MKNFVLIGAAGYIAPRHLKAIKETNNNLLAAVDHSDSVGILDSYFPEAAFFTEFERFDRHLEKLKRSGERIDYIVICSPNYLHDAHIRFGLRYGANVICEKPIVLNPWNLNALKKIELDTTFKVYTILQLRLHENIIRLREKVLSLKSPKKHKVKLTYLTSRGNWYYASWKGQNEKSGGIATNIGIHFFDMLIWIFGKVEASEVHVRSHDRAGGFLKLENADVEWFLGINPDLIPQEQKEKGQRMFRHIEVDREKIEFTAGFEDLHTISYKDILDGNGFTLNDATESITLIETIRNDKLVSGKSIHELSKIKSVDHPFKQNWKN